MRVSNAVMLLALSLGVAAPVQATLWRDLDAAEKSLLGAPQILTTAARVLALDLPALEQQLSAAPVEFSGGVPARISLPLPDGRSVEFHVQETRVMHPALGAKYPQIRTYVGQGITEPTSTLRLSTGPKGLRGMIQRPGGTVYLDPYQRFDPNTAYDASKTLVYFKRDAVRRDAQRLGPLGDEVLPELADAPAANVPAKSSGTELRTYRVVIATTGEYFQFHNPPLVPLVGDPLADKGPVLEELVNVVNRVSGIYEREVAVRMELQPETEAVMFSSAVADPYLDNDPVGLISALSMVQTNPIILDTLVGPEFYDIGHVVSTGGGGVAGLGVVCGSRKGAGVTGLPEPIGDPFYVDYVAHEMGHQFGGNHTFNGVEGSCSGGNRNGNTAYEPGSGSTIQAYAGICGSDNLQPNSDDYFHSLSYDEIVAYTTSGGGTACGVVTPTTNLPPVAEAGPSYTIPKGTPFVLTGEATDPDGDALTYQWEEFDLGPASPVLAPSGDAPIFRSFDPTPDTTSRVFPRLEDLVANRLTIGESLPVAARQMTFRFIARDNAVLKGAGGVDFDFTDVFVTEDGPFRVTAPNSAASVAPGSSLDVTWDVAGTDAAPISCATVDIDLSTDGGFTYAQSLAKAAANTGTASVKLPMGNTDQARVRVKCSDNIFFDISDADFSIGSSARSANRGRFGGALAPMMLMLLGVGALLRRRSR